MEKNILDLLITRDVLTNDIIIKEEMVEHFREPKLLVLQPSPTEDKNSITFVLETFSKDHRNNKKISRSSCSYTFPHPINKLRQDIKITGCCNGLVCIYDLNSVYLIDPVTREHHRLSSGLVKRSPTQSEMPLTVGFGRDTITEEYKLILIYYFDNIYPGIIVKSEVLTLDNGERRCTTNSFPLQYDRICTKQTSIFANGSLFWLTKPFYLEESKPTKLVAIDLHTEKFREVSFPCLDINYYCGAHLWSMKDCLCLSNVVQFLDVEIWHLQEENPNARWEKNFSIDISNVDRLDTNFWTLGLAAAYFRPEGEKPHLGDLDQVPLDQWKITLY